MLPNKLIVSCLRSHIPSYTSLRYVRGGYTMEVKVENRKKKESHLQEYLRLHKLMKSNVGVGGALHLIQNRTGKLDPDLVQDDIEEITFGAENTEAEFKEKYRLAQIEFDRKSLQNIRRKYFKEPKLPNMVPYCEKQDMKILHENDPENWDVEKLSESFPVTPEVAKKILSSPFTAHTVEQVKKHDETVKRNWKLFKEGKLQLSAELQSHYEKFVDRVSFETRDHVIKKYLPPTPNFEVNLKQKEYGSIIEKYEQTKPTKIQINKDDKQAVFEDLKALPKMISEENLRSNIKSSVTLDKFRQKIKNNPNQASELSKIIVEMEKKYVPVSKPKIEIVPETDYLADAEVVDKTYENSLLPMEDDYPLRIEIPKDKRERNKLYQVKDRFYNHRGYFLYRVPGLFR